MNIFKLLFLILSLSFVAGCDSDDDGNPISDEKKHVKYEVTGSALTVSITMSNETGGTEQISDQPFPWTKTFTVKKGDHLYLSAQNNHRGGDVTANIYVDQKLFKTSSSAGDYVIATASGNA